MWQGAAAGGVYDEAARPEVQGAGARDCAAPVLALRPRHAGARVPGGGRALRVGECHDLEQAATRALMVSKVIFSLLKGLSHLRINGWVLGTLNVI